ncbi:esterase/lipase family protein [Kaarinaea lacus]
MSTITLLYGCGLKEIRDQTNVTETVGVIEGKVEVTSAQQGPVVVKRFRLINGVYTHETSVIATSEGYFRFIALPDEYYITAFIDANKDGVYQLGEHGNIYGKPTKLVVKAGEKVEIDVFTISGEPPSAPEGAKSATVLNPIVKNIGHVTTLNNPMFVRDNYSMGLWKPIDFLEQIGGGLFFLQEYQKSKVPIVFVHGANGGPLDWQALIDSLDKERFQPWVLYYPSGLRLDIVSDYFVKAVTDMQSKYGFKKIAIVAHSMGGLVTRSFVKKYIEHFSEEATNIQLVMTINSPMQGMPSAVSGVAISPIVVPSWRDIATGSEFIKAIHAWDWPATIPYHLVFSYKSGDGDDGVVALQSQIPLKLQSESVRMYGFNNDHSGTLRDEQFLTLFNQILANSFE